jgi:L-lysine exporter family protein LysE/ArgO
MPIGTQNIFVISSAVQNGVPRAFKTALIVSLMDISLGLACFFGLGLFVQKYAIAQLVMLILGAVFLFYYGYRLLKSDVTDFSTSDTFGQLTTWNILKTCFVLTWLNPQAIIDGSILLGGFRASLSSQMIVPFILGTTLAQVTWFFGVSGIAGFFRKVIAGKILYRINLACGAILVIYGIKLSYQFIQQVIA